MRSRAPALLTGFGLLLAAVAVGEAIAIRLLGDPNVSAFIVGIATGLPFILGLVYGGHWLRRSDISAERYSRIVRWSVGGLVVFTIINLGAMVAIPPQNALMAVGWIRWAVAIGAGTGLLVGFFEARAIEHEVEAIRSNVRAEEATVRQELLDYLNGLLRHEVLNTANVIAGHAELLRGVADGHDALDVIQRQSRELVSVVEDVRVLLNASSPDSGLHPVDVTAVLSEEVGNLADRHAGVEIETAMPEEATVLGDSLLRRVFSNLLSNAVEHNPGTTPRVAVTVSTSPDLVTVRVSDNGPGIAASEREELFKRGTGDHPDHGLGLAIVDTLVDRYGGRIALTDTGADGTTFTVELPAVDASVTATDVGEPSAGEPGSSASSDETS